MAVKSVIYNAETKGTERMPEDTTEIKKLDSGGDDEITGGKEAMAAVKKVAEKKEELILIYIGPSLPAGQLKSNKIFVGTMEKIEKELEAVIQEYPLVKKLLVPVEKAAEKKEKTRTAGNILNKYCSDLISRIAANEREEN